MRRVLINFSNHPSTKWEEPQQRGWDIIYDVPFPIISPQADTPEVEKLVEEGIKTLLNIVEAVEANPDSDSEIWLCLLGEYTYIYSMYKKLLANPFVRGLAVPTTQRVVVEEDGGRKTSIFQFVRWRLLPLR